MLRLLTIILLTLTLTGSLAAQTTYPYAQAFQQAYQQYPSIPRGMLEAISYTQTRIRHVEPNEASGCSGIPQYVGVMGLIADGKGVFRENMQLLASITNQPLTSLASNPSVQIMAFAHVYERAQYGLYSFANQDLAAQLPILAALSELPLDTLEGADFALNSYFYSVLTFLNDPAKQQQYGFPAYQIDLRQVFGANYDVLSSGQVIISPQGITNGQGQPYSNSRSAADYPNALWNPAASCNYGSRNGTAISAVTVHTVQGSYAGCISWFQNCNAGVSAHYVIRSSDGQVTQMVPEANRAYHVGSENPYTVGIEHEGYVTDPSWYTPAMYQSSANLVKYLAGKYIINPLSTYKGSAQVVLSSCYRIKGHTHYPNQSHTDPGVNWNWPLYHNLINDTIATTRLSACIGTLTDNGGSTGNYTDLTKYLTVIQPAGAVSVTINFTSFSTEAGYDSLYIYDGNGTGGTLLGRYTGTQNPGTLTANSGTMSLLFTSDCSINSTGFAATWSCAACPGSLSVAVDSLRPATCNPGYIRVEGSGGTPPYTYVWGNGTTGPVRTNMPVGAFTVSVTDANGCSVSQVFSIPSTPNPSLQLSSTPPICYSGSDGMVTVTASAGTLPYSYAWNVTGNFQTIVGVSAGTYTVTVTDGAGCTATASTSIASPDSISITTDSLSDASCQGGYIAVSGSGGTGALSLIWNDGNNTAIRTGLNAGNYSVTVVDAYGCSNSEAFTINSVSSMAITATIDSLNCPGAADAGITVSALGGNGPYGYLWNTGSTSTQITNLSAGVYSVTTTDANGCIASNSFTINSVSSIAITATIDSLNCPGDADAGITVSVSGGNGPYSYLWNTGSNSTQLNNLSAGVYSITTTDANGCIASVIVVIGEPDSILINAFVSDAYCVGQTGSITLTPAGGRAPYQYQWNTGSGATLTNLSAGNYAVTVTDGRGCTAIGSYSIAQPTALQVWGVAETFDSIGLGWDSITGGTAPFTIAELQCRIYTGGLPGDPARECSLRIQDAYGCVYDTTYGFGVWQGVKNPLEAQINIYPNPTNGSVNITWQVQDGFVRHWLVNALGQVLQQQEINPNTTTLQLDLKPYSAGTYWLLMENQQGRKAMPVLRE